MIWYVHPETPQKRRVEQILKGLAEGKVCIVPTDTVYAFVCRLDAPRAINQIYKLKDLPDSRPLSLLCRDLTMASYYARGIPVNDPGHIPQANHTPDVQLEPCRLCNQG